MQASSTSLHLGARLRSDNKTDYPPTDPRSTPVRITRLNAAYPISCSLSASRATGPHRAQTTTSTCFDGLDIMRRFSSLRYAPSATRGILRDRFNRYLPQRDVATTYPNQEVMVSDESMLRILQNITIEFRSDLSSARATYAAAISPSSTEPSLDNLDAAGWFRVVWGRITIPHTIAYTDHTRLKTSMPAFAELISKRHEQTYCIIDSIRTDPGLTEIVAAIESGHLTPFHMGCRTPEWVAARLWDRTIPTSPDLPNTLRAWLDKWQLLHHPPIVPSKVWGDAAAATFQKAAFLVLESEATSTDWAAMRADFTRQHALVTHRSLEDLEHQFPPVPNSIVARARWLDDYSLERLTLGRLTEQTDIADLVHLLLSEAEAEDHARAPHPVMERLFELAIDNPDLFLILLFQIRRNSKLLADLLLFPKTSALACLLVATWQSSAGAWDRELLDHDDRTTQATAFTDSVSVMGHFLHQATLEPREVAALMESLHYLNNIESTRNVNKIGALLSILRGELLRHTQTLLLSIVSVLMCRPRMSGLGTGPFSASLDIIDIGNLVESVEPTLMVTAYIESIRAADHTLSANGITNSSSICLYRLASHAPPELFAEFLYPFDSVTPLASVGDENLYLLARNLERSLRAHMRILCRAVAGWSGTPPDRLVNALCSAVRTGAHQKNDFGQIAAFSPRHETYPQGASHNLPIATDIGAALGRLAGGQRQELLGAILETDEPTVLAQLLSEGPYEVKQRITERIIALTPSVAGDIHSLPDAQARVDALLSANLADTAELFIDAERELETWGRVTGRELVRLQAELRLKLLREDWDAIRNVEPPADLSHHNRQTAVNTIDFYKALAALKDPTADRRTAEHILRNSQARHPEVPSYTVNLFAVRIALLLTEDMFTVLEGVTLVQGRQVLTESEEMWTRCRTIGKSENEIFYSNKAMLLLACGQPEEATELLTRLHAIRLHDTVAAYSAVGLARLDRLPESVAILDHAELVCGRTAVLLAARGHIQTGASFGGTPNFLSDSDVTPHIKALLFDLKQLDHMRQAEALVPPPRSFERFVLEQVRESAASLTSIAPMMRSLKLDSQEDDITSVVRELLTPRFHFLGWALLDQSKGGYTKKGNPGERDLLIKKDSTTLAVIEAMVCKRGSEPKKLQEHFQRLFSYSDCALFFHLVYSYVNNPNEVLKRMRKIGIHDAPDGFAYVGSDDIPYTDARPVGFIAEYRGTLGSVKVVFLVLDMAQTLQKGAARLL